jgi:hypothetical protein
MVRSTSSLFWILDSPTKMTACFATYFNLLLVSGTSSFLLTFPIVYLHWYHLVELCEYNTFTIEAVHEVLCNHIMLEKRRRASD